MARFVRAYPPKSLPSGPAILLPFVGDELICQECAGGESLELLSGDAPESALYLGDLDGVPCAAYFSELPADDDQSEPMTEKLGLRGLFGRLTDDEYMIAGYALCLLRWTKNSRFCPACGEPTPRHDGWGVKCGACGFSHYPPVSPAVLCLVHDGGDRILLSTKEGWGARWSILAGFTEPGESLEGTCLRETIEEAGIEVQNPVYDGSQPWPFPQQLMVAFWAIADPETPLVLDTDELKDARWFHVDELATLALPGHLSLSRQTIDRWIASRGRTLTP